MNEIQGTPESDTALIAAAIWRWSGWDRRRQSTLQTDRQEYTARGLAGFPR